MTQSEIIKKYPELFGEPPYDPKETLIAFGLEVSEYWLPILEKGFAKISEEVKKNNLTDYKIIQVKEKFGTLRIYDYNGTQEIHNIIEDMEKECMTICEKCGSPEGKFRHNGWMRITCDKCEGIEDE
jgi:hypothetical protein